MKINYEYYLKRKRSSIELFIKENNFKSYQEIKEYFLTIGVSPPGENEVKNFFQYKNRLSTIFLQITHTMFAR